MGKLDGYMPIRFSEQLAAAARQCAAREGMSVSAWVRLMVDQEIARREGLCRSCGQPVPDHPAETAPDLDG